MADELSPVFKGHRLHIQHDGGDSVWPFAVWLYPETDDNGLVIGIGSSRDDAVEDAVRALETALAILQGPAPISRA